ncbi:MAG: DUF4079 family protein [Pseudomonadota bacterium]
MLYIHPVIQVIAVLLTIYALFLGLPRLVSLHLGRKRRFARQRHIRVGELALSLMILGTLGGLIMVRIYWHGWLLTGEHGENGLIMLPFMLFGLISGLYMARSPQRRKALPLIHALNNLLVLILALHQAWEGREVIERFLLGG